MSLFEDQGYQWRETYFVLFQERHRPQAQDVLQTLKRQDRHFEVSDVTESEDGKLESLTLRSHEDSAALDITYLTGEEVTEQIEELLKQMARATLTDEDREKLNYLGLCDARFDIYHFEENAGDEEEEVLDPGTLLLVMEQMVRLCHGVGVDPQSGTLM